MLNALEHASALETFDVPVDYAEAENGPRSSSGTWDLVDCYTFEATEQPLLIYRTAALGAGDWVVIDDLEISVDEDLSPDEVAQCIFVICGGDLHDANGVGETGEHWVYYNADLKGLLGLSPRLSTLR